jgi:hypothetical protein
MFRKRTCFLLTPGHETTQLRSIVDSITQTTELKRVIGRLLTGAMICNLLQTYAHRLRKRAPPVITRAYEIAVASEARRNKERMFLAYLDKMAGVEATLPTDDDSLLLDHQLYSLRMLEKFDQIMAPVLGEGEVQTERMGLVERMEDSMKELREKNFNASQEFCRNLFETLLETTFKSSDNSNIDARWQASIASYREKSSGPCADLVLADNVQVVISHFGSLFKESNSRHEMQKEQINRELQAATRQLLEFKDLEVLLRTRLSDANSKVIQQAGDKDRQVAEIQASVNIRAQQAEAKVRDLTREVQGLKLEIEQALKEKEMMIEAQRDILDKRIADTEAKYQRAQMENLKLERQLDEIREQQEKSLLEKNEQIGEMARKLKLIESQEGHPHQDNLLVVSVREYLQDILSNFTSDLTIRARFLGLVEQLSQLQAELSKVKLKEQELRVKLVDDYEEQIKTLRQTIEDETHSGLSMMTARVKQLQKEVTDLQDESFSKSQRISGLTERVTRLGQERDALDKSQQLTQAQLEDQMEVIEVLNASIEALKVEADDKVEQISRLKFENVGKEDDNDILIQLMGASLEYLKRQRGSLRGYLETMHNAENRMKVELILNKFRVPYV